MAETTNLLNQARGGTITLQDFQGMMGQGTPNINQPQMPDIQPTNIRPDVPEEAAPAPAPGAGQQIGLADFQALMGASPPAQPAQGLPTAQTIPASPEVLGREMGMPEILGRTAVSTVGQAISSVGRGFLYGITEMSDMLAKGLNEAVFPVQSVIGSVTGNRAEELRTLTQITKEALPPESKEFGNRVAVEVGKAIPLIMAGGGAVQQAAKAGVQAPRILAGMADDLARLGPTGLAKLELAVAAIGGAGGEGAVEAKEALGLKGISDNTARLAGSLITSLGANVAANTATMAKARLAGRPTTHAAKAEIKVGRAISQQAPKGIPAFESLARRAEEITERIPGFKLGLAETSREPGLQRLSSQVIGASPEVAETAVEHVMNNADALNTAFRAAKTQLNPNDVTAITKNVESKISSIERAVADQINAEQATVESLQGRVAGVPGTPALAMREAARGAEFHLSSVAGELFGKVGVPLQGKKLFNLNESIGNTIRGLSQMKGRFTTRFPAMTERSPLLQGLQAELTNAAGKVIKGKTRKPASFEDIRGIIISANEEISTLSRRVDLGQGDTVDAATLSSLRDVRRAAQAELDKIQLPAFRQQYPGVAEEFIAAKETFKEATTDIRSSFFRKLVAKDKAGQQTLDDSVKLGTNLLQTPEKTKNFLRVMAGFGKKGDDPLASFRNPEAIKELANFARESFVEAATKNGQVDAKAMQRWIVNHKGAKLLPGLSDELRSATSAQQMVDQLQKASNKLFETDDIKILQNFIKGADPHVALEEILASPKPLQGMQVLYNTVKSDPAAVRGIKQGLWEHLERRVEVKPNGLDEFPILNTEAIDNFTKTYQPILKQIMTPAELSDLEMFRDASFRLTREAKAMYRPSGNPKLEKEAQEISGFVGTIVNRLWRGKSNITPSVPYTVEAATTQRIMNSWSEKQNAAIMHAMQKAIFDPEAAKLMKEAARGVDRKVFYNRLANYSELHSNAISVMAETMRNAQARQSATNQPSQDQPNR